MASLSALLLALPLVTASTGGTAPSPLGVDVSRWQAPESCPRPEHMLGQVLTLLGETPPRHTAATPRLDVGVEIRSVEAGYMMQATFRVADTRWQRTLRDVDCASLTRALSLLVAIELDEGLRPGHDIRSPAVPNPTQPQPPVESAVPPTPIVPKRERRQNAPAKQPGPTQQKVNEEDAKEVPAARKDSPRPKLPATAGTTSLRLAADVRLDWGAVEHLNPGLGLTFGPGWRAISITFGVSAWLPRRIRRSIEPEVGGVYTALSGIIDLCGYPGRGRWRIPVCAGLEAGALLARGIATSGWRASYPWFSVHGSLGFEWQATKRLRPFLGIGAYVLPDRPSFVVDGYGEVHRSQRIGLRAQLGLVWQWDLRRSQIP